MSYNNKERDLTIQLDIKNLCEHKTQTYIQNDLVDEDIMEAQYGVNDQ